MGVSAGPARGRGGGRGAVLQPNPHLKGRATWSSQGLAPAPRPRDAGLGPLWGNRLAQRVGGAFLGSGGDRCSAESGGGVVC